MLVYFRAIPYSFISFDDRLNVTGNPHVYTGLTKENLSWAFEFTKQGDRNYWHPLTSISHMIDCQLYGLSPNGHHLSNIVFHICNTILLYLLLFRATAERWKSTLIAAIFALHPLNVESVVWIAERKNVLSTIFLFLGVIAYIHYLNKKGIPRYALILIFMFLGLLCKPILVVLPFLLLLMDIWPFQQFPFLTVQSRLKSPPWKSNRQNSDTRLIDRQTAMRIAEKIPMMVLSLTWVFVTSLSMKRLGVSISTDVVPMSLRTTNAIVTCSKYLFRIFRPFDLAIFYPYPRGVIPAWQVISSGIFLLLITFFTLSTIRKRPWIAFGWFWFLGTLFPALGLMQNGLWPEMADRWAYIPMIGILVIAVWELDLHLKKRKGYPLTGGLLAGFFILLLIVTASNQTGYWKNDKTLFQHAIEVTKDNAVAFNNLGGALLRSGDIDGAIMNYRKATRCDRLFKQGYFNLGKALSVKRRYKEAIAALKKAIQIDPHYGDAFHNLGAIHMLQGKNKLAEKYFAKALKYNPDQHITRYNLGMLKAQKGDISAAFRIISELVVAKPEMKQAVQLLDKIQNAKNNLEKESFTISRLLEKNSNNYLLYYRLGEIDQQLGNVDNAAKHFHAALLLKPDYLKAINSLIRIHVNSKDYSGAIQLIQKAITIAPGKPVYYYNMACLHSIQDQKKQAIHWLNKAIEKGYGNYNKLLTDNDLANIRATKEFQDLTDHIFQLK